ncbi:MAG: hypothetical protein DSM106950_21535 [Stigonema ocellatum SAG 48.90 = DSM 106950]|nr:hypothetical protein [Stigonema ocellatum SAG 48.90 = DSM 106950]
MKISDISHLEVASEDNSVVGGNAFADAYASANASGRDFSASYTTTNTSAYASGYYFYNDSSSSSSSAHSTAA